MRADEVAPKPTRHAVVTIDGPAGAGKSTVARRLAERLGFAYVNSGAIYRAVAWRASRGEPVEAVLRGLSVEFVPAPGGQRVHVDGQDVTETLYTPAVSERAATLSRRPDVRAFADRLQRDRAARGPVVVEGRDAGTVVFPEAECKFYLDASPDARARRRFAEQRAGGGVGRPGFDPGRHRGPRRGGPDALGRAPRAERRRDVRRLERDDGGRGRGADGQGGGASVLYPILKGCAFAVSRVLFRLRVVGADRMPREGRLIVASNHVSLLDPPLVGCASPRELDYMAKAELFRIPGLGGLIRRLNAHPVDRTGSDSAALRLALRLLETGRALLVFPEGTRGTEGRLGPARAGRGDAGRALRGARWCPSTSRARPAPCRAARRCPARPGSR